MHITISLETVQDRNLPLLSKVVYGILGSFKNLDTGICSPSLIEISARSGVMVCNLPKQIRELKEYGYIEITKGKRRRNIYKLLKP